MEVDLLIMNNASTANSYNALNAHELPDITDDKLTAATKKSMLLKAFNKAEYKCTYNRISIDISNVINDYANALSDDELKVFTSSILKNEYYYRSWRDLIINGIMYNHEIQITPQLFKTMTSTLNQSNVFLTACNALMRQAIYNKSYLSRISYLGRIPKTMELLACEQLVQLIAYAYYTNDEPAVNDIINHATDTDFIRFMTTWLKLHSSYELVARLASMPTANKDYKNSIARMLALKSDTMQISRNSHDDADNLINAAIRMLDVVNKNENIHIDDDTVSSILNRVHVPFAYAAVSSDVIHNDSMRALLLEAYVLAVDDSRNDIDDIFYYYDNRIDGSFINEVSRFIMLVNDYPGLTPEVRREVMLSCLE